MKKKYYFDCPIQALYMMREFDVKFLHWIYPSIHKTEMELLPVGIYYLENIIPYFNYKYAFEHRFIVAPESEHIFEPKEGDLGQMKAEGARFFVKYSERSKEWKEWHGGGYYSDKNGSDIIYRNNKHFFNPKEEN